IWLSACILSCCHSRRALPAIRASARECRKIKVRNRRRENRMSAKKSAVPKSQNGRPVWAEVSLSALTHNLHAIRDFVNPPDEKRATPRKVLCIVKGNGYGHGGPQIAKALERAGSDWFGVTSAAEGEAVRKAGVRKPILALTSFWPGEEDQLLKNKISPAVIACEQLGAL